MPLFVTAIGAAAVAGMAYVFHFGYGLDQSERIRRILDGATKGHSRAVRATFLSQICDSPVILAAKALKSTNLR